MLGGAGGGSIHITANRLTLSGTFSANGLPGTDALSSNLSQNSGAGGGSGGSISIKVNVFSISRSIVISANGGRGGNPAGINGLGGGGGGGGLILFEVDNAVVYNNQSISANGGITPCSSDLNPGPITTLCAPGKLIITNV